VAGAILEPENKAPYPLPCKFRAGHGTCEVWGWVGTEVARYRTSGRARNLQGIGGLIFGL
jgi:hypothetical protein